MVNVKDKSHGSWVTIRLHSDSYLKPACPPFPHICFLFQNGNLYISVWRAKHET